VLKFIIIIIIITTICKRKWLSHFCNTCNKWTQ